MPSVEKELSALHTRWLWCRTCPDVQCIHYREYIAAKKRLEQRETRQP
jgi:hypothetical protein